MGIFRRDGRLIALLPLSHKFNARCPLESFPQFQNNPHNANDAPKNTTVDTSYDDIKCVYLFLLSHSRRSERHQPLTGSRGKIIRCDEKRLFMNAIRLCTLWHYLQHRQPSRGCLSKIHNLLTAIKLDDSLTYDDAVQLRYLELMAT